MRGFKKISIRQYILDCGTPDKYEVIQLPKRATKYSAGYDICTPNGFTINPGQTCKVATGLRAIMNEDEVLVVHIRSSIGAKSGIRISNCTGIIDSDYCLGSNEGHIWLFLRNDSDKKFIANSGDRIAQGVFQKYLVVDDDDADAERNGGVGSTGK